MTRAALTDPSAAFAEPSGGIILPFPTVESSSTQHDEPLTVSRVVASLQLLLATRRAARNEDLAYWHNISRGM